MLVGRAMKIYDLRFTIYERAARTSATENKDERKQERHSSKNRHSLPSE